MIGIKPIREGEAEPYAVLSDDGLTVTFYYDDHILSRKWLDIGFDTGKWQMSYATATTAVFDDSFADYEPYYNSIKWWFAGCSNLKEIKSFSNLNTDNVTDMDGLFWECSSLTSLDLSSFKTDNVTDMGSMFTGCSSLKSLDLSGFKIDNVKNMNSMFNGCSSLTSLDLSGFKTDNVKNMIWMFHDCSSLTNLDLSGFKTDNVTDMSCMFSGCSSLTSLDLSDFKTDNVTDMSFMFYSCSELTNIFIGDRWSTNKVTTSTTMFYGCNKLVGGKGTEYDESHTDHAYARIDGGAKAPGYFTYKASSPYVALSDDGLTVTFYYDGHILSRKGIDIGFDIALEKTPYNAATTAIFDDSFADYKPKSTSAWFKGCSNLQEIKGVSNLNTDDVTNMSNMFEGCSSLKILDLSSFKTDNVTDMSSMFLGCSSLTTIYVGDEWSTGKVTSSYRMFDNCTKLVGGQGTKYDSSHTDYAYARIDDGTYGSGYLTYIKEPYAVLSDDGLTVTFYYDRDKLSRNGLDIGFDIALGKTPYDAVTTAIFDDSFADCKLYSTSAWFKGCSNMKEIKGLSNLNTYNVTDMSNMFEGCSSLTSLDLSSFKTDNVTDMSSMFLGCSSLTTIYVGDEWSTGKVTSSYRMFDNCTKLVGGQGTKYDSSHTDYAYARIDDGTYGSGYLTYIKEPYAVLSDDGLTVTFYYDRDKLSRNGVNIGYDNGKWKTPYVTAKTAVFDDSFADCKLYSTSAWFKGCPNLKEIKGLSNLNTDNVTNMSSMFSGCSSLTSLDLSCFKTDNVTDMSSMFDGCSSLMSLDLSGFKTDDVTYMKYMFSGCSSLTSLDVSSFKTNNVKDIKYMFYGCSNLTTIYAGDGWNVKRVTSDNNMFAYCTKLVGGQGTKYNSSYTDNTYARIDGGTEAPGYLTYKVSSGIKDITVGGTIDGNVPVYDIGGSLLPALQKGINIIRFSNGQIKKVFIK